MARHFGCHWNHNRTNDYLFRFEFGFGGEFRGEFVFFIYEASGGITFDNAAEYAAAGVDIISLGALTHSVRSLDVKFEIEMVK